MLVSQSYAIFNIILMQIAKNKDSKTQTLWIYISKKINTKYFYDTEENIIIHYLLTQMIYKGIIVRCEMSRFFMSQNDKNDKMTLRKTRHLASLVHSS